MQNIFYMYISIFYIQYNILVVVTKEFYCSSYKKTANRVLVLVICSKSPENTRLTFRKKLNFSRHAYKSTSSLTDGPTLEKMVVEKLPFYCTFSSAIWSAIASSPLQFLTFFFFEKNFWLPFEKLFVLLYARREAEKLV